LVCWDFLWLLLALLSLGPCRRCVCCLLRLLHSCYRVFCWESFGALVSAWAGCQCPFLVCREVWEAVFWIVLIVLLASSPEFGVFPVPTCVHVTDLQGPPLECTQTEKLRDLKKLAQHYAHDRGSCDDVQISYLETLEDRDNDNLRLAQMISR
jgi:hypothetical protein